MKFYINDEVETSESNGIFKEHFPGFVKTAQEENVVIIVRPVNPITKTLVAQNYPPKPLSIKNKSADWGIQAGFIISLPELSFLNKIGLKNNETQLEIITMLCKKFSITLDKNNNESNKIDISILNLKDNETILKITGEHFLNLANMDEKFGIIDVEVVKENNEVTKNWFIKCLQPKNKQNQIIVYLEEDKAADNFYKVYYVFALDNENKVKSLNDKNLQEIITTEKNNLIYFPITVFCKEIGQEKKPLIPDYDLFAICWAIDDAIKFHQPRIPTNSFAMCKLNDTAPMVEKEINFNKIFKKPHSRAKGLDFQQHPKIGNALDFTKIFLDKLGKNLGYEGLNDELCPIRHTFELSNPFARDIVENCYTIFLPNLELLSDFSSSEEKFDKNKSNIIYFAVYQPLVPSNLWKDFLEDFLKHIQLKGYYVPNNCFIAQTNFLGFINSSNPWVSKMRKNSMIEQFKQSNLHPQSNLSLKAMSNVNVINQEESVVQEMINDSTLKDISNVNVINQEESVDKEMINGNIFKDISNVNFINKGEIVDKEMINGNRFKVMSNVNVVNQRNCR